MRRPVTLALAACLLLTAAAPPAAGQARACTTLLQNTFVRNTLQDIYLWYRDIPDADPARFASPEAYLEAVRYRPLDQTFSFITSVAANTAFYSSSQFVGFGFSSLITDTAELRVAQVFPDSPAAQAGLQRGDRILEIDGRRLASFATGADIDRALGPAEIGVTRELLFSRASESIRVRITKTVVTIPTVSLTRTFDVDGRKVGYIFFRNFVEPSIQALDAAFAELRTAGATELVLDLRYNGGGLVSVAQHLASLIGGAQTTGQVFVRFAHNDRHTQLDQTTRFESSTNSLSLSRLFVITTRSSASASELVINALRPFIPVIVVGDRTYGKPVGQYGFTMCNKVLYPVSFATRNAAGDGDYFGGIPPTCPADDDVEHPLGDAREGSLRESLTFIRTGACATSARSTSMSVRPRAVMPPADGWTELVGAH